jgi:uncharacterized protein YbaP (TraB family)
MFKSLQLAGLVGCALAVGMPTPAAADAAVWTMKGQQNTVYLLGSVHLLDSKHATLPANMQCAYKQSEALVMEIDLDDLDEAAAAQFMMAHGMLGEDETLQTLLPADLYSRVTVLAEKVGLPMAMLEKMKPWLAATMLAQFAMLKSGLDPKLGVDMQLAEKAKADRKEITGLETIVEQLQIFDTIDRREQLAFLDISSDDLAKMTKDTELLMSAWRSGDERALEQQMMAEYSKAPVLYDKLLRDRNRKWVPQLLELRNSSEDVLVVVGAGHLVGKGSVIELLRGKGAKIERLTAGC